MTVVPFKKTGTAPEDTQWDWNADAQNKILGDDGDNWANYKAAHTWFDDSESSLPERKEDYKLPHHRQGDNGLEAVWHGVSNAMARLSQTDIPEDDASAAFDHLAKHYDQWGKEPPEKERWMKTWRRNVAMLRSKQASRSRAKNLPMMATRAAISLTAKRDGGTPTDGDLALINALARSPLTADQVYVVPAEISNQGIDAYFTRMSEGSLEQFAQDANSGVAFCDSHQHMRLPIGRSFYGTTATAAREGESMLTTQSLAYMLRGLTTSSGINSDDIIRGIEAGIYNDVSIGFIPEHFWCSVCGLDMLSSWECWHWPGQTYEVNPEGKGEPEEVLCVATVDASLAEYSLVYDGATPNAMVLKAEREMEAGRATPRLLRFVEETCRIKLRDSWRGFSFQDQPSGTTPATTPSGLRVPAHALATVPATPSDDSGEGEDEDMRGSEFIRAVVAVMERSGKEISQANLDRLMGICDSLSEGHDSMRDAIEELGNFLTEKAAPDMSTNDEDQDGQKTDASDDVDPSKDDYADGKNENQKSAKATSRAKKSDMTDDEDDEAATSEEDGGDGEAEDGGESDAGAGEGEEDADDAETDEDADDATDDEDADDADEDRDDEDAPSQDDPDGDGDDDTTDDPEKNPDADEDHEGDDGGKTDKKSKRSSDSGARRLSAEELALIETGRQAREEAIDEALAAASRAFGAAFDEDRYASMLMRCETLAEIRQFRDDWQSMAREVLGTRGRFVPARGVPGGGHWTAEPTGQGGRQTVARDPNDPAGIVPAGATPAGAPRGAAPRAAGRPMRHSGSPRRYGTAVDPSLFKVDGPRR